MKRRVEAGCRADSGAKKGTRVQSSEPDWKAAVDCETLILVPPFASLARPALGVHILQACARAHGHEVVILYSNMMLARLIGEPLYEVLCHGGTATLLGERFFAAAAFGKPLPSRWAPDEAHPTELRGCGCILPWQQYAEGADKVAGWVEELAAQLAAMPRLRVVGATTTFEQTASSLAILRALKHRRPELLTILGGANCEGAMSRGLSELAPFVDHFFSGESEVTFPAFLNEVAASRPSSPRVLKGELCRDLDSLPTPRFDDYYEQLAQFLPESILKSTNQIALPYESSRGCWWGAKHHCTFCGLNGEAMTYREKSPERVLAELKTLLATHPTRLITMVDNIMPHRYFTTLLPKMATELSGMSIFYEQKSNLSFAQIKQLKAAGVTLIQPGIESLSSELLALMDKGVSGRQNLALLRYARMCDLSLNWNLLYGFPGDRASWYQAVLDLIPLIPHLEPPDALFRLSIDRFSPYFERPAKYGLRNLSPKPAYEKIFPPNCHLEEVAYHFDAEYESESLHEPELIQALREAVARWHEQYAQQEPETILLAVLPLGRGRYLLHDSRKLPRSRSHEVIREDQARLALFGQRSSLTSDSMDWARERQVVVHWDGQFVPLAITDPGTYEFLGKKPWQGAELRAI